MRLIVVGMDGANLEVFERGYTPFIQGLIESGAVFDVKNDLLSRGWLEITTGRHAQFSGAMYDRPRCDGTYGWSLDFRSADIIEPTNSDLPLWSMLNSSGWRVGIMNVPTTFPAPEVEGFSVSGGGGGAPVVSEPTEELCYPRDILPSLLKSSYIVDERLIQMVVDKKVNNVHEIFSRMARKNTIRTKSFIELAKDKCIDFGFLVYKTSSVMTETLSAVDFEKSQKGLPFNDTVIDGASDYYKNFDDNIRLLASSFPNAAILFVSDHGTIPRKSSFNPNVWLEDSGYQFSDFKGGLGRAIISKLKRSLPLRVKVLLKKNSAIKDFSVNGISFNSPKTTAFLKSYGDWRSGVYINDSVRFGGPVSPSKRAFYSAEIVSKFNSSEISEDTGIKAVLASGDFKVGEHFPDVTFEVEDGCFITDRINSVYESYATSNSFSALGAMCGAEVAAMKSIRPIVALCRSRSNASIEALDVKSLTDVYQLILKYMGQR